MAQAAVASTTRRSIFHGAVALAAVPAAFPGYIPVQDIGRLDRAITAHLFSYPGEDSAKADAWAADLIDLECTLADQPVTDARVAEAKLRHLFLPEHSPNSDHHFGQREVLQEIIDWLRSQ